MPDINPEVLNTVASVLKEKHSFATTTDLDKAVAEVIKKTASREARGNSFSLSRMIRGLKAMQNSPLNDKTIEQDVAFVKALTTGSTPGSYLVPTIQAGEVLAMLASGGVARAAGVRIWPMDGIQKMNVPAATTSPSWVWMAQNSVQTATDPNLSQLSFDLKTRRCLVAIPNELLKTSHPAFDTLLAELIGIAGSEHEDTAFFGTTTVSGGPTALYAASGLSTLLVGSSANGGNLAFSDILAVLAKSAAVKAKGPFVWFCSPRTFFQRVLGMVDSNSRPIVIPTQVEGLRGAVNFTLMGYPVFVSPFISEVEANGSGTNQSHIIFTNPNYCHLAQGSDIEIAVSADRYFDANQTAVRATHSEDFGFSPAAGIVVLQGVN